MEKNDCSLYQKQKKCEVVRKKSDRLLNRSTPHPGCGPMYKHLLHHCPEELFMTKTYRNKKCLRSLLEASLRNKLAEFQRDFAQERVMKLRSDEGKRCEEKTIA